METATRRRQTARIIGEWCKMEGTIASGDGLGTREKGKHVEQTTSPLAVGVSKVREVIAATPPVKEPRRKHSAFGKGSFRTVGSESNL